MFKRKPYRFAACRLGRYQGSVNTMAEKLTLYDPAAALVNDEEIVVFMADALETGNTAFIAKALKIVARAKGRVPFDKAQRAGMRLMRDLQQSKTMHHDAYFDDRESHESNCHD
jgi:probable addiction module antidote protein